MYIYDACKAHIPSKKMQAKNPFALFTISPLCLPKFDDTPCTLIICCIRMVASSITFAFPFPFPFTFEPFTLSLTLTFASAW